MKEVSKKEFFEFVNPRDICVYCVKVNPIAVAEWKTRAGLLIGRSETNYDEETKKYFLIEDAEKYSKIVEE